MVDAFPRLRRSVVKMDPRKFLKRLARDMGLLGNDSEIETPPTEKVSNPENFQHRVHVALDQNCGGFVGLPPQWKQIVGNNKLKGNSTFENGKTLAQGRRDIHDDNSLGETFSKTTARRGNIASLAASLETPRSRASVADNQDIVIERLRRELRDYKAKNAGAFNESSEDRLQSPQERMFDSTRSLNHIPTGTMAPNRILHRSIRGPRKQCSTIGKNTLFEFDESLEKSRQSLSPNKYERHSISNGNIATSSQPELLSSTKLMKANGNISSRPPWKLNGNTQNGNPRLFRRSESEV